MRELEEVAPGVLVATSRTMSTTSTVLAGGGEALLIDPAWHPDELDALADALDERGLRVVAGFSTHAHHDHLLWHPRFGRVARGASAVTARLAVAERLALEGQLGADFPTELRELFARVEPVAGVDAGALGILPAPAGFAPELVVHDGHAPGHTAVWLPEQRVLVAGDMLSDIELPLPFGPDDLPAYLAGLDALAPYVERAEVLVPGHGTPAIGRAAVGSRLAADRRYLDDVVRTGRSDDPRIANPGMAGEYAHLQRMLRS